MNGVLKVAIVGAGPSGFYTAAALLRNHSDSEVSLIERLPVPYGLVRYGVAPDHPSLKTVTSLLERTGKDPRVTFFGNTTLWRHVTLPELLATHHAVILAIGAPQDRAMAPVGNGAESVYRASQMVGWYNSDPDHACFTPNFGSGRVCIFGHGNVAADIARILLSPPERLRQTDISARALAALEETPVRDVYLIGRRGPADTRFTPPVIEELLALPDIDVTVDSPSDWDSEEGATEAAASRSMAARDVLRSLRKAALRPRVSADRRLRICFGSTPDMIRKEGDFLRVSLTHRDQPGVTASSLAVDAVISATGFHMTDAYCNSLPLAAGALSNHAGQLIDAQGQKVPGLFTVGWAARGATGTIGTCRSDAERLVQKIVTDTGSMTRPEVGGRAALMASLAGKDHLPVSFDQWLQLDRLERDNGAAAGRSRLKVPTINQMLDAMTRSA